MKMLIDCDYFMDSKKRFYIVKGYWNSKGILSNLVYTSNKNGDRVNSFNKLNYLKVIENNKVSKLRFDVQETFYPKECFKERKHELKGSIWGKFYKSIIEVGIPKKDIGIFGSFLIGFDIKKDIDFVVYGIRNFNLLKSNIDNILQNIGAAHITQEHINYQIKKHTSKFSKLNSFDRLLKNKWSSVQVKPGVLSTIRFVYKPNEIPENPFSNKFLGEIKVKGEVIDDLGTNFCPRIFTIKTENGIYKVATYFWVYQSCVKKGMRICIKGNLRENNTITLDRLSHWINVK